MIFSQSLSRQKIQLKVTLVIAYLNPEPQQNSFSFSFAKMETKNNFQNENEDVTGISLIKANTDGRSATV